jgi:hypothetical protein
MLENGRAVAVDRLAEEDAAMPMSLHEILKAAAAILDRRPAKVAAGGRQQVEGDHDGLPTPPRAQQAAEVTVAVRPKDYGLTVEHQVIGRKRGDSGSDAGEAPGDDGWPAASITALGRRLCARSIAIRRVSVHESGRGQTERTARGRAGWGG